MHTYSGVPMKHSISTKLLSMVFGMYLGVAVVVTLMHVWLEYVETSKQVTHELRVLQKAFERSIATSLWYLDKQFLESEMRGLLEHYLVVGVSIESDRGDLFRIGETPARSDQDGEMVTSFQVPGDPQPLDPLTAITHTFPLHHIAEDGEGYAVGTAAIYSSKVMIARRLQWKLLVIGMASLINMAAFWVLVLWVGKRVLSRPLAILTEGARQLNLDNLEHFHVNINTRGRDELKILEETFNAMVAKLLSARTTLYEYANELHQSRQQLQDILDNATAIIFLKDAEGRYLLINRQFETTFHVGRADILGKTDYDVFPRKLADAFRQNDRQVIDAGAPFEVEETAPHDDGLHTYMSIKFPLHDLDGQIYAVCGIATDISERKQAEARIRKLNQELEDRVRERTARLSESEQRLKEAQRIAQLGNWTWDIRTNGLQWSDEVYRMFGVQPQAFEATYDAFLRTVHPDDRDAVRQALDAALYQDEPYRLDHRIVLPDGTVRVVHAQGEVTFDEQQRPARMLGTVQNVTERKATEDALRANEQQLRLITDNSPAYIAYVGIDDLRYRFVNRNFEIAYARPREEIIGQHIRDIIGEANYQFARPYLEQVRRGEPASYENTFTVADGPHWIQVNYVPDFDEQGKVRAIVVLSHDITDLRRANDAALEAQRQAEAANRAKSVFLANMSHELRTPLHGILGFAEQLARDSALTAAQQQHVAIIARSGERLLTLVNDILDFTKIEANQLEMSPSQWALADMLMPLVDSTRRQAAQKGLLFAYEPAGALPGGVVADQKRLRQILMNLLDNAIRFTEHGTVTLKVWANEVAETQTCRLGFEVSDTGIGIAPEHLEAIFSPFQQADPQQLQEGRRGLGLAMSRRFVEMMGGRLEVSSRVGAGSTFWCVLEMPVVNMVKAAPPAARRTASTPAYTDERNALMEALSALPEEWRRTLGQGAEDVDIQALAEIVARISGRDLWLAERLRRLVEDFDYDEILYVLNHVQENPHPTDTQTL